MISVDGESNESLVLDGEWLEKLRGGAPKGKQPLASFRSVEWQEFEKRTKLFGGQKVKMVQVVLTFEKPPFLGFITGIENRPRLEEIVLALEAGRTG